MRRAPPPANIAERHAGRKTRKRRGPHFVRCISEASSQTFLPEVSNAYGVNFGANARIPSNIQTPQILEELPAGIQAISKESGAPQPPSNRREVAVFARAVREGSCDL